MRILASGHEMVRLHDENAWRVVRGARQHKGRLRPLFFQLTLYAIQIILKQLALLDFRPSLEAYAICSNTGPIRHQIYCTRRMSSPTNTTKKEASLSISPLYSPTTLITSSSQQQDGFFGRVKEQMHLQSRSRRPHSIDTADKDVSTQKASPSSSATTSPQSPSRPKPTTKRHNSASSGTYSQCGRHSNEWLFNNFSVSGAVKGLLERRDY